MSGNQAKKRTSKTVRASVDLHHQVIDGQKLFALPLQTGFAGPCDGKSDGASCGEGCTCRGGQPWYSREAVAKLGFRLTPGTDE
jgi:hypothetical protein